MVRLSSGLLDRNISSSRGFYAYLAFSVAHSNKKKANEHIAWLLKLLAQLFPHMEVAERNLQLKADWTAAIVQTAYFKLAHNRAD